VIAVPINSRIMVRVSSAAVAAALAPDRLSSAPLYRQLYEKLRQQILTGAFGPGQQIPSSRVLAADLDVSRNTAMNAIEQLIAEGYLEGEAKTGTFVADVLPDDMMAVAPDVPERAGGVPRDPRWSQFGARLAQLGLRPGPWEVLPSPFRPGISAFDQFPFDIWSRLASRHWRNPSRHVLTYGDPAGYLPLRRAIFDYMAVARGIKGSAEQVVIVAGAQQGIDLTVRLLLDAGDSVWMEEPGYLGTAAALHASGASVVPVPVDESGPKVRTGVERAPLAKLACVTPSHQFPRGVTMTLSRRLELLKWAAKADAWILEDDYDSEYRYAGRPIPALQGLDHNDRVIYLGTFTKVLFPSIRLAYLVVPSDLVDRFVAAKSVADRQAPIPEQAILADFMSEGHFGRHIRRMRTLYLERAEILAASLEENLGGIVEVDRPEAGMHTIGWLPRGTSDRAVSHRAADAGVFAWALSSCYWQSGEAERPGLVLGFAAYPREAIVEGVRTLATVIKSSM
jgi:GntR family transcriptional regulator/MocR family aminotransferase